MTTYPLQHIITERARITYLYHAHQDAARLVQASRMARDLGYPATIIRESIDRGVEIAQRQLRELN
jgi:hypothetical protein